MYLSPVLFSQRKSEESFFWLGRSVECLGMDEYQFPGSNGAETFEEGAETMETEEGAGVTGPDETQEILR